MKRTQCSYRCSGCFSDCTKPVKVNSLFIIDQDLNLREGFLSLQPLKCIMGGWPTQARFWLEWAPGS